MKRKSTMGMKWLYKSIKKAGFLSRALFERKTGLEKLNFDIDLANLTQRLEKLCDDFFCSSVLPYEKLEKLKNIGPDLLRNSFFQFFSLNLDLFSILLEFLKNSFFVGK